jgi:hypothetical protein
MVSNGQERTCGSDCHERICGWPTRPSSCKPAPGSSSRSKLWLEATRPEVCALHAKACHTVMNTRAIRRTTGRPALAFAWQPVTECYCLLRGQGSSRCTRSSGSGAMPCGTHALRGVRSITTSSHLGVGMLMGFEWLELGLVSSRPNTHDPERRPSVCISRSSARDCS